MFSSSYVRATLTVWYNHNYIFFITGRWLDAWACCYFCVSQLLMLLLIQSLMMMHGDQQRMPQFASQVALSLSSDSQWEDNLTEFEKDLAIEEDEEVDEGMGDKNMQITLETDDSAFIKALISHIMYLNE